MTDVNEFIRLTLTAQILELKTAHAGNTADMETHIASMEEAGAQIVEALEVIEAQNRWIDDRTKNVIVYGNQQIENLQAYNKEIETLIKGIEDKLSGMEAPEPVAMEAPKVSRKPRAMFGKLTDDQLKKTQKKYRFLLEMDRTQRLEYVAYMRQNGYPENDTTIGKSLGKCAGWFGDLVRQARNAGYTVPDKA